MEQDVAMLRWYDGYDQQCIVDDKEQNEDAALEAIRQTYQADNLIWMRQAAPTTALIQALLEQIHSIGVLQQLTFCNVSTNTHVDAWESFFDALRCNRIWIHTILLSTHLCDKSWEWIDRLCTVLQYNRSVTQLRLGPVHAESNADPQTGRASMHVRQSLCRMLRLRQDTLNLNVFDACWWFGEDGIDPETNQPSLAQWACVQRGLLRLYSTHIPSTWSNMKQHTFHRVHIIAHREYANHEQAMTRFLLNNEIQNLYILGQPHGLLFEVYHRLCDPSLATTYLATHLQTVHLMRDAIRKQDRTEMQLADATYYRIPGLTQHVTNVLSKDRMQHLTADRSLWPQLSAIAVYYADELKYLPPLLEARPLIHTLSIHVLEGSNPFEIPADSSRQIAASHITCLHVTHLHGSAFHWLSDILFQPQCCIHTLILEDFDGITDLQWDMFFEPHVIHSLQAFVLANIFKPTSAVVGLFAALFRKLPCLPRLRIVPLPMHMSPRAQAALQQKLSWKEADMERINTLILSRQLHYVLTRDAWQQMACVFLWFTTLRDHTLQNSVIQFHYGIRRLLGGACVSDIDFAIEEMYDYEYVLQQHLWIVCQQEQQSLALFQRYPLDLFVLRDCAFVQSLFDAPQERVTAPMKRTAAVAAPKAAVAAAAQHKPTKHHNKSLSMKQQAAERRKAAQAQQDEKQQQQQKENDLLDCDVCISSEVQFKPIALDLAKHKRMLSVYEPEEELDRTPLHSHDVVMFDGFHVDWWNCVKHVLFCATQASDNVHALRNLPVPYRTWSVYQLHDGKFRILYLLSTRLDASVMIDQADLMEAIEQVVDIVCEQEQYDEDCILFLKQCEIDLKRRLSRVRGVVVAQR